MKKLLIGLVFLSFFFGGMASAFAETSYIYYYGQGCPHCANVDDYMNGVDGYNRVNMEKKEVWTDKENAKEMSDAAERLGLDSGSIGVPFLLINNDGEETYLTGDGPFIEYFTPILGEPKANNRKTIALIILGLLAVGIPTLIIMGGNKK